MTINKKINQVNEDTIKVTIEKYQNNFKEEKTKTGSISLDYYKQSVLSLINEIAGQFYPKSKKPLCELNISELIALDHYIVDKIENILSYKGLRLLKKLKLSTILSLVNTSAKINNSKPVQLIKNPKVSQVISTFSSVLSVISPVNWFKKVVINPTFSLLIDKICLLSYSIIGLETYNVYSKKALLKVEEDQNIISTLKEIHKYQLDENNMFIDENKGS